MLKGLLGGVTVQAVNLVNAHLIARERGLAVEVRADAEAASGYTNLITVTTQAGAGRKVIAGTVFDGVPRIVRLRDLHIEFVPEGHILVLAYEDRPGMVGRIGSILGRHNVNIASMHVGRRTRRGRAIVVLLLDDDVPAGGHGRGEQERRGRFRAGDPAVRAPAKRGAARPRWASSRRGPGAGSARWRRAEATRSSGSSCGPASGSACSGTGSAPSTGWSSRAHRA